MNDKPVPQEGSDFELLMRSVDSELADERIAIPWRPLNAVRKIGLKYGISIPMGPLFPGAPDSLKKHEKLYANINAWYEANYGERIKEDFSPGHVVVNIGSTIYRLRVPLILGSVSFCVSRNFLPKTGRLVSGGPVISNVLQLVEGMTEDRARWLSDEELMNVFRQFDVGLKAANILTANSKLPLFRMASGDVRTAVDSLLDRVPRSGESKWASLQAAEKVLKAAISLEGLSAEKGHDLARLCRRLEGVGLTFESAPLVERIQCAAGIRYGDEDCTQQDALNAHQASLRLIVALKDAGAKFKEGLAIGG